MDDNISPQSPVSSQPDFSTPPSMDAVSPTPPTSHRKLSWLNISLIALACVGVAVIMFLILCRKTTQDNLPPVLEDGKYLEYRKLISDHAFEITSAGSISGAEFVQKMNPVINQTKDTDYYQSIDIYATFLAARHNLSEIALGQFDYYINQDLNDKERCELYEYRHVIAGSYETNLYSPEENEENRQKYCAIALTNYPQHEDEDTFAYAERLYYEGFITESMKLFETIDPEGIVDDNQYDNYYKYVLSYYYSTGQYEKYHNARLGYTKYVTEESSEGVVDEE